MGCFWAGIWPEPVSPGSVTVEQRAAGAAEELGEEGVPLHLPREPRRERRRGRGRVERLPHELRMARNDGQWKLLCVQVCAKGANKQMRTKQKAARQRGGLRCVALLCGTY
eukprot:gene15065-biopygen3205